MAQYETVNGVKYEKELLDLARKAKGPIGYDLAEKIWAAAIDGNRVTDVERDTVHYLMAEKECTADARNYFHHKLGLLTKKCSGHLAPITATDKSSQYQTIVGLKYERELFNHAITATKGGKTLTLDQAKKIWEAAMDGGKITDPEFRTVDFIMAHYRSNRDAYNYLDEMLAGQKGKTRTFKGVSWIPAEEEREEAASGVEKDVSGITAVVQDQGSDEPPEKKQKIDEPTKDEEGVKKEEDVKIEVKEETELEEDAPEDKRKRVQEVAAIRTEDTTLNVLPSDQGNVLMSLSDGGLQYLMGGARADLGTKAGRYYFEVKIVEALVPGMPQNNVANKGARHPLLRIGVATEGSSLFLGETDDSVCFDSDGGFIANKTRSAGDVTARFGRGDVIGVLVNLDEKSGNSSTVSLFRNGARHSAPHKLPQTLSNKALFPAVSWRNMTLHMNFGPTPHAPLPFSVRMYQDAAEKDAVALKALPAPKDGKYELMVPVGLPDEGTFNWLDLFLEKNPQYAELSDRMIIDWALKSGHPRPSSPGWRNSNDKPEMNFGIPQLDDLTVRKVLSVIAPIQRRHLIVMEVRGNLLAEERADTLKRFAPYGFKTVAQVVVGKPTAPEFKKKTQEFCLQAKQEAAVVAWEAKKADATRKKLQRQLEAEIVRKAKAEAEAERVRKEREEAAKAAFVAMTAASMAEAAATRAEEDSKVAAAAATAAKEASNIEEEDGKKAAEEKEKLAEEAGSAAAAAKEKAEEAQKLATDLKAKVDEVQPTEIPKEEPMEVDDEDVEKEAPTVKLTEEEKKQPFAKMPAPDLALWVLGPTFNKFTLPQKTEGFDEIRYEWAKGKESEEYIKNWVRERKITTRMEELTPSDWFTERWTEFQKNLREWHTKQQEWPAKRAQQLAQAKAQAEHVAAIKQAQAAAEKAAAMKAAFEKDAAEQQAAAYTAAEESAKAEVLRVEKATEEAEKRQEEEKEKLDKAPAEGEEAPTEEVKAAAAEKAASEKTAYAQAKTAAEQMAAQASERAEAARAAAEEAAKVAAERASLEKANAEKAVAEKEAAENASKDKASEEKEELDIFGVEDVCNIGDGEPIFANWTWEDWTLLSLRFELHLLAHAFRRDVNDAERIGIIEEHIGFYYNKYFRKTLNTQNYGFTSGAELLDLIDDTVCLGGTDEKYRILESNLSDELDAFDVFVKLCEEHRRERQRLMDLGDDTVALKFTKPVAQPQGYGPARTWPGQQGGPQRFDPTARNQQGARPQGGGKGYGQQHQQQQQLQHLGAGQQMPQYQGGKGGYGGARPQANAGAMPYSKPTQYSQQQKSFGAPQQGGAWAGGYGGR